MKRGIGDVQLKSGLRHPSVGELKFVVAILARQVEM